VAITFREYQDAAGKTATYPNRGNNTVYPALGLTGEAGEAADKVKKIWRNRDVMTAARYTLTEIEAIAKELGDVLWYITALGHEIGFDLEKIAEMNIAKLTDRNERGVIKSEGDNR
jgi:NTP pyrophosphatase (non-canonical NTP hydrolase)